MMLHGYFRKSGDPRALTHYCEDGGSLHVSKSRSETFLRMYADEVMKPKSVPLCILEQVPFNSKLYSMMVITSNREIPLEKVCIIKHHMKMYAHLCYGMPETDRALTAFSRELEEKADGIGKVVLHRLDLMIVWPDIIVDRQTCFDINMGFAQKLKQFGVLEEYGLSTTVDDCFPIEYYRKFLKLPMIMSCRAKKDESGDFHFEVNNRMLKPLKDDDFLSFHFTKLWEVVKAFSFNHFEQEKCTEFKLEPERFGVSIHDNTFEKEYTSLVLYPAIGEFLEDRYPDYGRRYGRMNKVTTDTGDALFFLSSQNTKCFNPSHEDVEGELKRSPFFIITENGVSIRCHSRICSGVKQPFHKWDQHVLNSGDLTRLFYGNSMEIDSIFKAFESVDGQDVNYHGN